MVSLLAPATEGEESGSLLAPAVAPPPRRSLLGEVDEEEEQARPGSFAIKLGPVTLDFSRIVRQFKGAKRFSEIGTASMSAFPGIQALTGQKPKTIIPEVPKGVPFRPLLEAGRVAIDPLVGAVTAILGGAGMIMSPVTGVASEPLGAAGEKIAGRPGRFIGEVAGSVAEAFSLVGLGGVAAQSTKIPIRAAGQVLGAIPKKQVFDLPPGVSPIVPKDNKVMNTLGEMAIPNYKRDASFVSMKAEMAGDSILGKMQANKIFKSFTKLSKKIAKHTGRSVDEVRKDLGDALKGTSTNSSMNKAMRPFRDQINKLQQEAADLGLVSQELVDASVDSYLSRSYLSKLSPDAWQPSAEVEATARTYLQRNMRIPVGAKDPLRASESIVLEQTRRAALRSFRQSIRDKTPDVEFAKTMLRLLRTDVLGTARVRIKNIKEFLRTKGKSGATRETVEETVEEGIKGPGGLKDLEDLNGPARKLRTVIVEALETRGLSKPEANTALDHAIRAQGIPAEGAAITTTTRTVTRTVTRETGGPAKSAEAVAEASELLKDIQGVFRGADEFIKEIRRGRLTKKRVGVLQKEFMDQLERITGKGPVRFRRPTADEVSGAVERIVNGGEFPMFVGRGGRSARIPLGPTIKRKDIPKEIRALMGEIEEGPTAAAITIDNLTRMNASKRFLDAVSQGSEVIGNQRVRWVSDTRIPGYVKVQGKAWGPLDGKFVLEKYAADLADFTQAMTPDWMLAPGVKQTLSASRFAMNTFKVSKTVLNPATHTRNVLGNTVFADFAQIPVWDPRNWPFYARAATELMKSGKGFTASALQKTGVARVGVEGTTKMVREAIQHGALQTEFVATEVLRDVAKGFAKLNPMKAMLAQMQRPIKAIGRVYNAEDQIFKLASYMKQREAGATAIEAARHVNKWFPNYRDVTKAVKVLRQSPVGAPFITFSAEASRIFVNAAKQHPVKFVKWMMLPKAFSAGAAAQIGLSGEDVKKIMASLPDYLRQPFTVLWPSEDKDGNPQIVDGTYSHPLGAMFAGKRTGKFDIPVIGDFVLNNPIINTALEVVNNIDFFTGRAIVEPGDVGAVEIGKKVLRDFGPSLTPGIGTSAREIGKAVRRERGEDVAGRFGQRRPLKDVLVGELGPIRKIPVDQDLELVGTRQRLRRIRDLRKSMANIQFDIARKEITPAEGRKRIDRIVETIKKLSDQ